MVRQPSSCTHAKWNLAKVIEVNQPRQTLERTVLIKNDCSNMLSSHFMYTCPFETDCTRTISEITAVAGIPACILHYQMCFYIFFWEMGVNDTKYWEEAKFGGVICILRRNICSLIPNNSFLNNLPGRNNGEAFYCCHGLSSSAECFVIFNF